MKTNPFFTCPICQSGEIEFGSQMNDKAGKYEMREYTCTCGKCGHQWSEIGTSGGGRTKFSKK